MDKVILTSFSIEELAEAVFQKFSIQYRNNIETPTIDIEKEVDEYLTRQETAKLCKINSLSTLWNWKQQKKLIPQQKAGRKPLYLRKDVINFLNGKEVQND